MQRVQQLGALRGGGCGHGSAPLVVQWRIGDVPTSTSPAAVVATHVRFPAASRQCCRRSCRDDLAGHGANVVAPYHGGVNAIAPAPLSLVPRVGALLREWRATRRLSQLDLALAADTSTRHLSCVETGKSQPSRELVARLADALDMPCASAMRAARRGFAPTFPKARSARRHSRRCGVRSTSSCSSRSYPAFLPTGTGTCCRPRGGERVNHSCSAGATARIATCWRQIFDPTDRAPPSSTAGSGRRPDPSPADLVRRRLGHNRTRNARRGVAYPDVRRAGACRSRQRTDAAAHHGISPW